MTQAKGALMQLLAQRETTYRAAPSPVDALQLPFTRWNVGRDPGKVRDPSINGSPLPGKTGCGDATVQGSAECILDLRSIGFWLALALGVPTSTNKAVTKQPTNITGVTIHYAQASAGAGDGTLAYANTGKTLTWTDQGGTAGTPVDVTAGGRFTLPAGTASHGIVVDVAAADLPGADQTDSDIAVSATLKAHVFPIDLNDRPSALIELGHPDIARFYRTSGCKLNKIAYDIMAKEQNVSLDLIAGGETEETSAWDASPTVRDAVRACGHGGSIWGAGSLGQITGGTFSLDNGMQGKKVLTSPPQEGYGLIMQGELTLSGSVQAVFDGASAYALARAGTSTRLRIGSSAQSGSDVFSLTLDMPNVEFVEKIIPKEGKSGLYASLDWMAHRDAAGNLPLVVLVNDVAGY